MLIPFTAKWNANNACIAFCEGNGNIDSWAIIKNEAALSGIKIFATVTENWLIEVWVLAYLNTNNSGFRGSSQAWSSGTFSAINLSAAFTSVSVYQPIGLWDAGTKWISEDLLGDNMKSQLSHDFLTYKIKKVAFLSCHFYEKKAEHMVSMHFINKFNMHFIGSWDF